MTGQLSLFDYESGNKRPAVIIEQELPSIPLDKDIPGARLIDLVPNAAILALTRGYSMRAVHVARILTLLNELEDKGATITRAELGEDLSMTWASAQSYLNVMRRMALVDAKTRITPFGNLALLGSPRVDNDGLLWLLHYLVASDANLVLWSNLFNLAIYEEDTCTIQSVVKPFATLVGRWSEKTLVEKAPHEIGGILKTYTEELLLPLRLAKRIDVGTYEFYWNTALIPSLVWLSCILLYRDRYYPGATTLEVPLISRAHYSPGRILRQNEVAVRRALDELHNAGLLTVETRSGLDQVRFKQESTWIKAIAAHLQVGSQE